MIASLLKTTKASGVQKCINFVFASQANVFTHLLFLCCSQFLVISVVVRIVAIPFALRLFGQSGSFSIDSVEVSFNRVNKAVALPSQPAWQLKFDQSQSAKVTA